MKRIAAINKFKSGNSSILVATDVASRGLDIPSIDAVINYDVPPNPKDYVHRVGRTARAGRSGRGITVVTQYDVEMFQKIEFMIGKEIFAECVFHWQVLAPVTFTACWNMVIKAIVL